MTDSPPHEHISPPRRIRRLFFIRVSLLAIALTTNIVLLAQLIPPVPGVIVFAGAVITYTLISILLWKCPQCGKYPGNAVMPDYCDKCGHAIFGVDAHVRDLEPGQVQHHIPLRYLLIGRTLYGLALLAYFVVFASVQNDSPVGFWAGALTFILTGAWLEWRWWRCPSCGGYLRRSIWPGRSCLKCGEPFRY